MIHLGYCTTDTTSDENHSVRAEIRRAAYWTEHAEHLATHVGLGHCSIHAAAAVALHDAPTLSHLYVLRTWGKLHCHSAFVTLQCSAGVWPGLVHLLPDQRTVEIHAHDLWLEISDLHKRADPCYELQKNLSENAAFLLVSHA